MTTRAPQIIRRCSAVTLVALASLVMVACGGGSGPSSSRFSSTVPFSERPASDDQTGNQNTDGPEESEQTPSNGTDTDTGDTEQVASDDEEAADESKADDDTNDEVVDSGSSSDDSSGDSNSGDHWQDDSADDVYKDVVTKVDGLVTLEWYRPRFRENGDPVRDGEIGGYEVRYRQVGAQEAQSIVLDGDEWELEYELEGLKPGEYEFSVAAYDSNGLYSEFVGISPVK